MSIPQPKTVEVKGKPFFVCDYTGELCTTRFYLPGKKDIRKGCFLSWNVAVRAVEDGLKEGKYTKEQALLYIQRIRDKSGADLHVYPSLPASVLTRNGGNMSIEKYKEDYVNRQGSLLTGGQDIKDFLVERKANTQKKKEIKNKEHKKKETLQQLPLKTFLIPCDETLPIEERPMNEHVLHQLDESGYVKYVSFYVKDLKYPLLLLHEALGGSKPSVNTRACKLAGVSNIIGDVIMFAEDASRLEKEHNYEVKWQEREEETPVEEPKKGKRKKESEKVSEPVAEELKPVKKSKKSK